MSKLKITLGLICLFLSAGGLAELRAQDSVNAKSRVKKLITQLNSPEYREQESAAMELKRIGWPDAKPAVPALIKTMKEADMETVKRLAIEALAEFGPGARSAVPELKKMQKRAYGPLRKTIDKALLKLEGYSKNELGSRVSNYIKVLQDPQSSSSALSQTVAGLGEMGLKAKPAVPYLINLLKNNSHVDRLAIIKILGGIDSEGKSVPAIRRELKINSESELDGEIIHTVSNEQACVSISQALGKIGANAKSAVPELITVIKNRRHNGAWSSKEAIKALGDIGPSAKAAIPYLEQLNDEPFAGGEELGDALSKIKGVNSPAENENPAGESE